MGRRNRLVGFLFLLLLCFFFSQVPAGESGALRIAILDFAAPAKAAWLGPAVAESLTGRLADCRGISLMERDKLLYLKQAALTPKVLGVNRIVTGQVQLDGPVADRETSLRLSVRLIASETGAIASAESLIVSGKVGDLLKLETQLAGRLAESLKGKATAPQLSYHEPRTFNARQQFGAGLLALQQAEAEEKEGHLKQAIRLLRQAQVDNKGVFFARAHHYETLARERLAKAQVSDEAAKAVRKETVKQFETDAAGAAPALFDLGRAYEATGQLEEASTAYSGFIRWMGDASRIVHWKRKMPFHQFWGPDDPAKWPSPIVECRAMRQGKRLYLLEKKEKAVAAILCIDWHTGETLWQNRTLPGKLKTTLVESWRHDEIRDYYHMKGQAVAMAMAGDKLFYLADRELALLDAAKGNVLKVLNLPLILQSDYEGSSSHVQTGIHPVPGRAGLVLISRSMMVYRQVGVKGYQQTMLVDTRSGKVGWKRERGLLTVAGDRVILGENGSHRDGLVCELVSGRVCGPADFWVGHLRKRYGLRFQLQGSRSSPHRCHVWYVDIDGDSKTISYDDRIDVVDLAGEPKIAETHSLTINGSKVDAKGRRVRSRRHSGFVYAWDSRAGKVVRADCPPEKQTWFDRINHVSGNSPAQTVLWGDLAWHLKTWDTGDQEIRNRKGELIHTNRFGAGHAHFLVGPGARLTTLAQDNQVINSKLAPPPKGTFSEMAALLRRADAYLRLGQFGRALADVNAIRAATENSPAAEMIAGKAAEALGKTREALNAYYACIHLCSPEDLRRREARERFESILPVVTWGFEAKRWIPDDLRKDHKIQNAKFLKGTNLLELKLYPWAYVFVDLKTMKRHVYTERVRDDGKGNYLPTTFIDPPGKRIPMFHYPTGGDHMKDGLFYFTGCGEHFKRTRIYDLPRHRVVRDVTHQVPEGFHEVNLSDRYTPECVDVGICLWERGQRGTELCATSQEDGRLLWKGGWDRDCYERVAFFADGLLVTYGGNKTMHRLTAREPLTGKITLQQEYSLKPANPEDPVAPLQVMPVKHFRPTLWNRLLLIQDYRKRYFWIDLRAGRRGRMPEKLVWEDDIDNNLRGEARLDALQNPEAYLKKYPLPESRLYLGAEGASPYLYDWHMHAADGAKLAKTMPLCEYEYWPYRAGNLLLIQRKGDRWLLVRAQDYIKAFAPGSTAAP